jgi:DUF4097 and DUF4098 domain-containing protein YvlB
MPPAAVRRDRRSIFSGLLLVIVGAVLLVAHFDPHMNLGFVITHFWPVIIIVWGAAKLIDRYPQPQGAPHSSMISGGEVALIIAMITLLGLVVLVTRIHGRLPRDLWNVGPFTQQATETRRIDINKVDQPKSLFAVTTESGAINVHAGADNGLHVVGTATASADTEQAARERLNNLDLVFDGNGVNRPIHTVNQNGGVSVDLDVQLPKVAGVTARSQHGDITVADIQGATDVGTRNGTLQIHDVGGALTADIQNGDAHIRNVGGDVSFTGRGGGDVEITDVQGGVTIGGNVFGDVDVRNAAKGLRYSSPRGNVQIAALPGEIKIDNSEVTLTRGSGPIIISSRNQDLRLDEVDGQLDLSETHGDINITLTRPPKAPININNDSGDVNLILPPESTFTISAESQSGDINDDFGGNSQEADNHGPHRLDHTYGSGGPAIHITTRYGTIHIGKSQ